MCGEALSRKKSQPVYLQSYGLQQHSSAWEEDWGGEFVRTNGCQQHSTVWEGAVAGNCQNGCSLLRRLRERERGEGRGGGGLSFGQQGRRRALCSGCRARCGTI